MIAGIAAGLTQAAFAVLARITTQAFFEAVLTKVVISLLNHLVKMTSNTVDDDIVKNIEAQLKK